MKKFFTTFLSTVLISVPFASVSNAMDDGVISKTCVNQNCKVNIYHIESSLSAKDKDRILPESKYEINRRQIMLPCGCLVCTKCIHSIFGYNSKVNCPLCKKELPKDFDYRECLNSNEIIDLYKDYVNVDENGKITLKEVSGYLNNRIRMRIVNALIAKNGGFFSQPLK